MSVLKTLRSLCSNFTTLIFAIAVCAGVVPIVKSHELSIVVGTGSKKRKFKNKLLEREEKLDRGKQSRNFPVKANKWLSVCRLLRFVKTTQT